MYKNYTYICVFLYIRNIYRNKWRPSLEVSCSVAAIESARAVLVIHAHCTAVSVIKHCN